MADNALILPEESGTKLLKNNGVYRVEDGNDKEVNAQGTAVVSPSVTVVSIEGIELAVNNNNKRKGLKKWRRIPRELALRTGSIRSSTAATDSMMRNEISNLSGEEDSVSVDDHLRNGRTEPGKKARGFQIRGDSNSTIEITGSDSPSSNFVFVQGSNTAARYHEEESGDDKDLNEEEPRIEFIKSEAESDDDVSAAASKDQDPLVESIQGLHLAQEEFEREVEKWRDVGKDDFLSFTDPLQEVLELKDAKILELESALSSGGIKTELEDCLKKTIQADVEHVVITATTKRLTEGPLREIKHNLQHKTVSLEDTQATKKQDGNLETKESLKNLQSRVCRFTSFFVIQFILLLVTLYLKLSPQNLEVVPT